MYKEQNGNIYFEYGFTNNDSLQKRPNINYEIVNKKTTKYKYQFEFIKGIDTVFDFLNTDSTDINTKMTNLNYQFFVFNAIHNNYILSQVLSVLKSNYVYAVMDEKRKTYAGLSADNLPDETYSIFQYDDSKKEGINFYYYVLKSSDTSGFKIVEKDSCFASPVNRIIKVWVSKSIQFIQDKKEEKCNTPIIDHLLVYKNKVYFLSWDCVQPRKASKVLRNASRIVSGLDFIRSYSIYHNKRHAPY
jgi:hypothetical protein